MTQEETSEDQSSARNVSRHPSTGLSDDLQRLVDALMAEEKVPNVYQEIVAELRSEHNSHKEPIRLEDILNNVK